MLKKRLMRQKKIRHFFFEKYEFRLDCTAFAFFAGMPSSGIARCFFGCWLLVTVVRDFSGAGSFSLFPIDLSDTNFVFRAVFVTLVLDEDADLEFSKFLSFPTLVFFEFRIFVTTFLRTGLFNLSSR